MATMHGAILTIRCSRAVAPARAWTGRLLRRVVGAVLRPILKREYDQQSGVMNERPVEFRYAMDALVKAGAESVLDVGPGVTAWPALLANCGYRVTAVDEIRSYWRGMVFLNRHWWVEAHDITTPMRGRSFDGVTCISTLEHIPNHRDAVRVMLSVLNPGGVLVITVPWNTQRYYGNAYDLPKAGYGKDVPYITQIYSPAELQSWLDEGDAELVDQEFFKAFTGDLWTVGERINPPRKVDRDDEHQLTCLTLRRR